MKEYDNIEIRRKRKKKGVMKRWKRKNNEYNWKYCVKVWSERIKDERWMKRKEKEKE